MINGSLKLQKYIVLGRETILHNLNGDDRRKLITEIYIRRPNTQMRGLMAEWDRYMYNELQEGGRGRDVNMEAGMSYMSVDGTAHDFIDLNFASDSLETHNIRFVKTYPNQSFMKRNRTTSFHKENNFAIDEDGNVYTDDDGTTP